MTEMDQPTTVIGLVTALVQAYAAGIDHYVRWKRRRSQQNHYRRQGANGQNGVVTCALSTSLSISGPQIKETYDIAAAIVGTEFSTGDSSCRDLLWAQLNTLNDRVTHLREATISVPGPLDLADIFQTSESARVASVQALTEQYQRIAAGRPIPKELPVPKPRSRQDGQMRRDSRLVSDYDDDKMTTAMTVSSGPLRFQSEPPSPPPTPKLVPDDAESTWAPSEAGGGGGSSALLRPKNSVFSIFCPVAMNLQVDVKKPVPEARKCKCGYRWKLVLPDKREAVLLKEGFRMTARFLAKSHCDKDSYGCVLCTSSGRTETYESTEHLRAHINASHTKWQMLHDRDMT